MLSHSFALPVPVESGRLHPPRSTNCCCLPDPIQWSVSAKKYSCSALPLCCSPSSSPVSFYLCLEHVDILAAYTASRPETGLLIPSGYNNCARCKLRHSL